MVALTDTLLTDIEDVNEAAMIALMWDGCKRYLCGEAVRTFVHTINTAYRLFPEEDCLVDALKRMPPEMRSVFEYLYEELKEVIK